MAEDITNAEETQEEEKTGFDIESFNTWSETNLGTKFEDEGSLKERLESYSKIGEYEEQLKQKDETLQSKAVFEDKYTTLLDKLQNGNILPDNETLSMKQLKEKYPDTDYGVLSKARSAELDSMSKLDALVLANKVQINSPVSDHERKEAILESLGIEDFENLTAKDQFKIDTAFAQNKSIIEDIKGFKPEGLDFDFESEFSKIQEQRESDKLSKEQELKEVHASNEKALKVLLDEYKEIPYKFKDSEGKEVEAKYVVDDGFKGEFFDKAVEELTSQGVKITAENSQEVADHINGEYFKRHWQDIVDSMASQITSQMTERAHNEQHVDSSQNRTERQSGEPRKERTLREKWFSGE